MRPDERRLLRAQTSAEQGLGSPFAPTSPLLTATHRASGAASYPRKFAGGIVVRVLSRPRWRCRWRMPSSRRHASSPDWQSRRWQHRDCRRTGLPAGSSVFQKSFRPVAARASFSRCYLSSGLVRTGFSGKTASIMPASFAARKIHSLIRILEGRPRCQAHVKEPRSGQRVVPPSFRLSLRIRIAIKNGCCRADKEANRLATTVSVVQHFSASASPCNHSAMRRDSHKRVRFL